MLVKRGPWWHQLHSNFPRKIRELIDNIYRVDLCFTFKLINLIEYTQKSQCHKCHADNHSNNSPTPTEWEADRNGLVSWSFPQFVRHSLVSVNTFLRIHFKQSIWIHCGTEGSYITNTSHIKKSHIFTRLLCFSFSNASVRTCLSGWICLFCRVCFLLHSLVLSSLLWGWNVKYTSHAVSITNMVD